MKIYDRIGFFSSRNYFLFKIALKITVEITFEIK